MIPPGLFVYGTMLPRSILEQDAPSARVAEAERRVRNLRRESPSSPPHGSNSDKVPFGSFKSPLIHLSGGRHNSIGLPSRSSIRPEAHLADPDGIPDNFPYAWTYSDKPQASSVPRHGTSGREFPRSHADGDQSTRGPAIGESVATAAPLRMCKGPQVF